MKILIFSDVVCDAIYSQHLRERFADVGMAVSCGDLPYYYVEYVVSVLNVPVFHVRGNHSKVMEYEEAGPRSEPHGATDLHGKSTYSKGLLLAGVEGCLRYRPGPYQYSQGEMWLHVLRLSPGLLRNRLQFGRYLDLFVTHAPPEGVHDDTDLTHRGIKAFRWLLTVFRPRFHIHGHTHRYRQDIPWNTQFNATRVVNAYGYRKLELD